MGDARTVRSQSERLRRAAVSLAVTLVAGLASACQWGSPGGMVVGSGDVTTSTRSVSEFTEVEAGGGIQLELTTGPQRVVVRAQPNLLDVTTTEVSGSRLKIETTSGFVSTDGVVVQVSAPSLSAVALSGGASVSGAVGTVEDLALELSGGAQATLTGRVTDLDLDASGGAIVDLDTMPATNARIDLSGGVVATLNVWGRLAGSASGGVVITLSAKPSSTDVETSGGAVIRSP